MNTEELKNKYSDLVWLARKTPEDFEDPTIKQEMDNICSKYQLESEELYSENGEWVHGFNSGMLACLRLVSCARIYPQKMEEFPLLDT